MHSKSSKLTVALLPAGTAAVATAVAQTATVTPIPVHPAIVVDSYYSYGNFGSDCASMTFI